MIGQTRVDWHIRRNRLLFTWRHVDDWRLLGRHFLRLPRTLWENARRDGLWPELRTLATAVARLPSLLLGRAAERYQGRLSDREVLARTVEGAAEVGRGSLWIATVLDRFEERALIRAIRRAGPPPPRVVACVLDPEVLTDLPADVAVTVLRPASPPGPMRLAWWRHAFVDRMRIELESAIEREWVFHDPIARSLARSSRRVPSSVRDTFRRSRRRR